MFEKDFLEQIFVSHDHVGVAGVEGPSGQDDDACPPTSQARSRQSLCDIFADLGEKLGGSNIIIWKRRSLPS
jgi:hypothetical protein